MTDDYYDEENDDSDETPPGGDERFARVPRDAINRLEKKAKRADDAEKELASYKRRDLFRQAGIDPDHPQQKYLVAGYSGPETIEAIKAEAVAAGYLEPDKPAVSEEELAAHAAVGATAAGGVGASTAAQEQAYLQELASAPNSEAAMQVMVKYGKPVTSHQQ